MIENLKQRLLSLGFPQDKIEIYCNDYESYADEIDYLGISDEDLIEDFKIYFSLL
jgi:hypothetical protein